MSDIKTIECYEVNGTLYKTFDKAVAASISVKEVEFLRHLTNLVENNTHNGEFDAQEFLQDTSALPKFRDTLLTKLQNMVEK